MSSVQLHFPLLQMGDVPDESTLRTLIGAFNGNNGSRDRATIDDEASVLRMIITQPSPDNESGTLGIEQRDEYMKFIAMVTDATYLYVCAMFHTYDFLHGVPLTAAIYDMLLPDKFFENRRTVRIGVRGYVIVA